MNIKKKLELAIEALHIIENNDKTQYAYKGKTMYNRNGQKPVQGSRFNTPREIAWDCLQIIKFKS